MGLSRRFGLATLVLALAGVVLVGDGLTLDFSTGRTFTLAPGTRALLGDLDREVTIELFFARRQPGLSEVAALVDRVADASGHIQVQAEDPDGKRALALGVASGAVAVTAVRGEPVVVRGPDEVELVGAIAAAIGRPAPDISPNRPPTQPLYPTALGRALLFVLPVVVAPIAAGLAGGAIAMRRRRDW